MHSSAPNPIPNILKRRSGGILYKYYFKYEARRQKDAAMFCLRQPIFKSQCNSDVPADWVPCGSRNSRIWCQGILVCGQTPAKIVVQRNVCARSNIFDDLTFLSKNNKPQSFSECDLLNRKDTNLVCNSFALNDRLR